jgi:uncharacterized phage-associated protein
MTVRGDTIMGDIKFEFNLDKLIHAIAFFYANGINDLTKLKVAKLLYFADKRHLLEHGVPIIGDMYFCMQYGPVPSVAMNEMSEAINESEVSRDNESDYSLMNKVLRVRRGIFGNAYPRFEAKQDYDPNVFVASELAVLQTTTADYGQKTARQLVDLTHQEPTWKIANEGRSPNGRTLIPYELFFEGASQQSLRYLAKLKAEFSGEVISLQGDVEYSEFATRLREYDSEPSFDLDSDQIRKKKLSHTV